MTGPRWVISRRQRHHREFDPAQLFPTEDLLEDTLEDISERVAYLLRLLAIDAGERVRTLGATVLVQAEDFGGSIPMPFYGFARAQADYFNSNLLYKNQDVFFVMMRNVSSAKCKCFLTLVNPFVMEYFSV